MAKCKFKVGDKVKATKDNGNTVTGQNMEVGLVTYVGKCGTFADGDMRVKVLKHKDEYWIGHVFPVESRYFEKVEDETIVIYREDNKVIALDKSTGKKAFARCSPTDIFDFHTGTKLAFDRLMGNEKSDVQQGKPNNVKFESPKYYTGTIEILTSCATYERGAIIEIKDGLFGKARPFLFPTSQPLKDFADVVRYFSYEYSDTPIEIKEIKKVKRMAKVGEYVLVTNVSPSTFNEYKTGDILKICETLNKLRYYKYEPMKYLFPSEYVVLEGYVPVKNFEPYLRLNNCNYGTIGKKTNLVDIIGRHLEVGDVVEPYCNVRGKLEDSVVVNVHGRTFVMGVALSDFSEPVESKGGYKILLKKKAKDVSDGTMIRKIKYIKSERQE